MRALGGLQVVLAVLLCGLSSCASSNRSAPAASEPPLESNPLVLTDSELELVYLLGRERHQLRVEARADSIRGANSKDGKVLKDAEIAPQKYRAVIVRIAEWASQETARENTGNRPGCKTPFLARARVGSSSYLVQGCRHTSSGVEFGRIAREAEFLLPQ